MNPERPFEEGFQDPVTKESVFGEIESPAEGTLPLETGDEDGGEEEAEGLTSGTAEIVREQLDQYLVPKKFHSEIEDVVDQMMTGKLGKELQEETGFDEQVKAAIAIVEKRHGLSFEIEYDEAD